MRQNRFARAGLVAILSGATLFGCIPQPDLAEAQPAPPVRYGEARAATLPAAPPPPAHPPAIIIAQRILDARITELGRNFDGEVGIAVRDVQSGWTSSWNGRRLLPQQSVSKLWVALAAFDRVDRGELNLAQQVTITREDLTLFHQPIRELVRAGGHTTSLDNLLFRAIAHSDNTANDFILWRAGGPDAVRETLRRKGIEGIRFGPGERLLQSEIAGLQWQPQYSIGNAFYQARNSVPLSTRRASFERYIADPIDGASPEAMVEALARLQRGELLSPESTRRMISIMHQTRSGPQRLPGGLSPGWRVAHKTGTGQVLGGTQAGYNDVGILTAPDGRHYSAAVLIGRTGVPLPTRMQLMQEVSRAVIAYHENMGSTGTYR